MLTGTLWVPAVVAGLAALALWRVRPAFALSLLLGAAAVTVFFFWLFSQFSGIEAMG